MTIEKKITCTLTARELMFLLHAIEYKLDGEELPNSYWEQVDETVKGYMDQLYDEGYNSLGE